MDPERIAEYADSSFAELAVEHRTEDIAQELSKQFVSYVLKESGQKLCSEAFDMDAAADAREALYREGFDPAPDDVDHSAVSIFSPPVMYHTFRDDASNVMRVETADDEPGFEFRRMRIYCDPSIPEDTAIAVHDEAVATPPKFSSKRPWLVRHPRGVVEIQILGDD